MIVIRPFKVDDLLQIQNCNLHNLPENYQHKYYLYHLISWPRCSWVAVNDENKIVGYVLAKIEEEEGPTSAVHGHITSLAVMSEYRKLGIAEKIMKKAQHSMYQFHSASFLTLHVRQSNIGAHHLYSKTLGFETTGIEKSYYADGEDAIAMRKNIEVDFI